MVKGMLKIALKIGFKLMLIGIIVAVPIMILNIFAMGVFGLGALITGSRWVVTLGSLIMFLPLLLLHMIAYGWLVYKWKKWVFN